jgi:hypothetical protein
LLAVAIGALEAFAVIAYALSLLVFAFTSQTQGSTGSDVAGPILALVMLALGALLGAVTWAVWRAHAAARTPFLLAQAFVLVAAWSLVSGDGLTLKVAGALTIVLAVVAAVSVLMADQDPAA